MKKKYILTTQDIVEAEQVDLRQEPWPDGVHPWPEGFGPLDKTPPAYMITSYGKQDVYTGDYIINGGTEVIKREEFERDYKVMKTSIQEIIEHALTIREAEHKQWYLWRLAEIMGISLRFDANKDCVDKGIAPQDLLATILQQSMQEKGIAP